MSDDALDLSESVGRDRASIRSIHPWFATRAPSVAEAVVRLTLAHAPLALDDTGVPARDRDANPGQPRVLDLFSGAAAIAGAAADGLSCGADAAELNPVAHVIARCTWLHGAEYGKPEARRRSLIEEY